MIKIGNAQGFWGDRPSAPARLVEQQPDLDFLTLDYLSEVSMSIMAIQREKNPDLGYAKDFIEVVGSLIPFWQRGSKVIVIANAGGLNPQGCAEACKKILVEAGLAHLKIGVVTGDNVLELILKDFNNALYSNLETGEPFRKIASEAVTANAYLGARPIVEALTQGASIVVTGRVADPSLTVAPCMAAYGWAWTDWDRIAGATIAGHLIECGTQVTGGISTDWLSIEYPERIGYPIAEVYEDGSCIITKPKGTSGKVSIETVKEQLLYEIGDPSNYISPDVQVSFLSLNLLEQGEDRILIKGAIGKPPPETLKVSATFRDGFKAEGMLAMFGPDAYKKGKKCGEIILNRVKEAGFVLQRSLIECLGAGDLLPGINKSKNTIECVMKVAVADQRREALECFVKEIAPMVTSGPQGVTGYTSGRPPIRQVFGYWPCLINADLISIVVKII